MTLIRAVAFVLVYAFWGVYLLLTLPFWLIYFYVLATWGKH